MRSIIDVLHGRDDGPDAIVRSVVDNLGRLLNTRRGSVGHLDGFGLPDLTEIYRDVPESIEALRTAVREAVVAYEPRLSRVRVTHHSTDPYDMQIVLVLHGELPDRRRIELRTTFSSADVVRVDRLARDDP
ncbi:type VI secretion system baseplate subunit TssE [Rubrivirga sp.]|uniref:type VI secretion system baseplate subunit TssE n=1 Tax=Rubrivirga sp. TaxID=1885344 RepID=UPI003B52491E